MSRVLKWNGQDVPEELRSLPAGRYGVEALEAIDRGEGESAKKVRQAIDRALKR